MSGSTTPRSIPPPDDRWRDLAGVLPQPRDEGDREDLLWQAFEAHFRWYHRQAGQTRVAYQALRLAVLLVGAVVTVLAALAADPWLTASLAAVVVAAEGVQQLFQFHANWISYRSTAERLRRHGILYAARVDPYDGPDRRVRLGRLLREATGEESAAWVTTAQEAAGGAPPAP